MIIAFGNKARHGKDTACEAIQKWYEDRNKVARKHDYPFVHVQKVNFGDLLKKEVTAEIHATGGIGNFMHYGRNFGWEGFKFSDSVQLDPNPPADSLLPHGKHSKILQWWGTEYRRTQDPDYWIKKWKEQVANFKGITLIADLRFLNEAAAIKSLGGHLVNVTRMNRIGNLYIDPTRDATHVSETELDMYNWDFYIKVVDGHVALVEQYAVALAEYLRALEG